MKAALEAKAEKTLSKQLRYPEGVMTRREHINLLKTRGYIPEVEQIRKYDKEEEQREYLRGLWHRIPNGNECHPETKRYFQLKEELDKGIFETVYVARNESRSYVITKTEYDYFNSL